jgi:hypothetical protein
MDIPTARALGLGQCCFYELDSPIIGLLEIWFAIAKFISGRNAFDPSLLIEEGAVCWAWRYSQEEVISVTGNNLMAIVAVTVQEPVGLVVIGPGLD